MEEKRLKIINLLTWGLMYVSFLILWTRISPVMVADADDWTYISFSRQAIPVWKAWNPAKVFPETFMSLCGNIAAFVVYPVINDWSNAMTYTFAFVIAAIVTAYIYSFDRVLECMFELNVVKRYFVDFFFVCGHFWVFKTMEEQNPYMFMSHSLNTEMNYRIPMFMAASLFFYIVKKYFADKRINMGGLIILWTYLTIFSNMATNIVLVIPVFVHFVYEFLLWIKNKEISVQTFLETRIGHIIVFAMEITVFVFEFFGGRAESLEFNAKQAIFDMASDLKIVCKSVNIRFALVVLLLIVISFIVSVKRKNKTFEKLLSLLLVSGMMSCVYIVLLFTRVGMHKITRADNTSVMAIFFVVAGAVALGYLLESFDKATLVIPIAAYIMFFSICNIGRAHGNYFHEGGNLYVGAHNGYKTAIECYEANTDIVKSFIEADKAGLEEFDLYVPKILRKYEWVGGRLEATMYRQGIIRRRMTVYTNAR